MEILTILQQPFMVRAIVGGLIVAVLAASIGVFITLRRQSFLTEAVAHASLTGVAAALLLAIEPIPIAIIGGIVLAVAITYFNRQGRIASDSIIGIFFSLFFAVGIILLNLSPEYQPEIMTYLFGSILSISRWDIVYAIVVLLVAGIILFRYYRKLLYFTFDAEAAHVRGVNTTQLEYLLNIIASVAVIVSVKVLGVILVTALFIIPASTAKLIAKRFQQMIPYAVVFSVSGVLIGLIIALLINTPPGAMIVVVSGLIFIGVSLFKSVAAI